MEDAMLQSDRHRREFAIDATDYADMDHQNFEKEHRKWTNLSEQIAR